MASVRGKGSIQALEKPERTCRRWRLQVRSGRDHVNGGYLRHTRVFHGTKTDAQKALRDFVAEIENGLRTDKATVSFAEYAEEWRQEREQNGYVSANTSKKALYNIRAMLPYIGNTKLRDLDTDTISRLMLKVRTTGGRDGNGRSGTTCRLIYTILNQILNDAVVRNVISKNPCDGIKPPKLDTEEKEALPTNEARRLAALLAKGEPDARRVGALLALTCGLRRGEVCALRWSDIDLKANALRVTHTLSSDGLSITAPKTKASRRVIPLDSAVAEYLAAWKKRQAGLLLANGISQGTERAVVSNSAGEYIDPSGFARWWRQWSQANGFGDYNLHQLRHSYATLLCANGVDLVTASGLMGHSGTAMLMKVYAHQTPENTIKAQAAVGNILFGKQEAPVIPFDSIRKGA